MNGTHYSSEAPDGLITTLESLRNMQVRCVFKYTCGQIVRGRLGRSTGNVAIPLVIKTSRSMGGEALDEKNLVEIRAAERGKGVIWRHLNYRNASV